MSTFGPAYDKQIDGKRIHKQRKRILEYMLAVNDWRTLQEIDDALHYPQGSISAQLRHLRKKEFGGYYVPKERCNLRKCWKYRVYEPAPNRQLELL